MKTTLWSPTIGDIKANLAFTNNLSATTDPGVSNDSSQNYSAGSVWVNKSASRVWTCTDPTAGAAVWVESGSTAGANIVAGVAAGYKIARGVHQIAAATDTIVTGLATVVSVVACFRDAPTVNVMFIGASIGDQAGSPAAGSFLLNSYKPTATGNVTPVAATTFSDNINVDWIAIGT